MPPRALATVCIASPHAGSLLVLITSPCRTAATVAAGHLLGGAGAITTRITGAVSTPGTVAIAIVTSGIAAQMVRVSTTVVVGETALTPMHAMTDLGGHRAVGASAGTLTGAVIALFASTRTLAASVMVATATTPGTAGVEQAVTTMNATTGMAWWWRTLRRLTKRARYVARGLSRAGTCHFAQLLMGRLTM